MEKANNEFHPKSPPRLDTNFGKQKKPAKVQSSSDPTSNIKHLPISKALHKQSDKRTLTKRIRILNPVVQRALANVLINKYRFTKIKKIRNTIKLKIDKPDSKTIVLLSLSSKHKDIEAAEEQAIEESKKILSELGVSKDQFELTLKKEVSLLKSLNEDGVIKITENFTPEIKDKEIRLSEKLAKVSQNRSSKERPPVVAQPFNIISCKTLNDKQIERIEAKIKKWKNQISLPIAHLSVYLHLASYLSDFGFYESEANGTQLLINDNKKIRISIPEKAKPSLSIRNEIDYISKKLEGMFSRIRSRENEYKLSALNDGTIKEALARESEILNTSDAIQDIASKEDSSYLEAYGDGFIPYDSRSFETIHYLKLLAKQQIKKSLELLINMKPKIILNDLSKRELVYLLIQHVQGQISADSLVNKVQAIFKTSFSAAQKRHITSRIERSKKNILSCKEMLYLQTLEESKAQKYQEAVNSQKYKSIYSIKELQKDIKSKKYKNLGITLAGRLAEDRVGSVIKEYFLDTKKIAGLDISLPLSKSDKLKIDMVLKLHDGSKVYLQIKNNSIEMREFTDSFPEFRARYENRGQKLKAKSFPYKLPRIAGISVANKTRYELKEAILNILNSKSLDRSHTPNSFYYREWSEGKGPQDIYYFWPPDLSEEKSYSKRLEKIKA